MNTPRPHVLFVVPLVALLIGAGPCWGGEGDWNGWRGPGRDGVAAGATLPAQWPATLQRRWSVDVGVGHASPVVADGRIYLHSRQDDQETVRALAIDGQEAWRQQYAAPYKMSLFAITHGKGPKATPMVAEGRLFTLGISGILSCWDAETGQRRWQREFSSQFAATAPHFGTAASPLMAEGLFAHVGGHDDGAFCRFDPADGKTAWDWSADGPSYASPVLATIAGQGQLITQTQQHCVALSPADGRQLWSIPFKSEYSQNIITPVVSGSVVIISGTKEGVTAYRIERQGDRLEPRKLWHNDRASFYMSSPVLRDGRLYGFSQFKKGQLVCLDAGDGSTLWTHGSRLGANAALVAVGDVLLALTTEAQLIVFRAGETFVQLAELEVADTPTWAHPVLVGDRVLVKDQQSLTMWQWSE